MPTGLRTLDLIERYPFQLTQEANRVRLLNSKRTTVKLNLHSEPAHVYMVKQTEEPKAASSFNLAIRFVANFPTPFNCVPSVWWWFGNLAKTLKQNGHLVLGGYWIFCLRHRWLSCSASFCLKTALDLAPIKAITPSVLTNEWVNVVPDGETVAEFQWTLCRGTIQSSLFV